MPDEGRTPSRRDRREAAEGPVKDAPAANTSQAPEIRAGFAFTTEIPVGQLSAASFDDVPGFATGGNPIVSGAPSPAVPAVPAQRANDAAVGQVAGASRRDRRRQERLDSPMETWSAEEETQATGQVPRMSPEAIANEEALSHQRAATAQADARLATGEVPLVGMQGGQGGPAPRPMVIAPSPDGSVPQALQHLFPPGPVQTPAAPPGAGPGMAPPPPPQQRPPARPGQPPGPSIDEHGRLVAPGGGAPFVVPSLVGGAPGQGMPGAPPMMGAPGPQGQPPVPQTGVPGVPGPPPQVVAPQTAAFEALVAGGPPGGPQPPTLPTAQIPGIPQGPFAPPGVVIPGMPPGVAFPGPGAQGMVVPGTGTLRTTGNLRVVPGTGAIPRPVVEVHPAGGVRHFGWVQLLLLAAAAFALGVVVWNVASRGS